MEKLEEILSQCFLFGGLSPEEVRSLAEKLPKPVWFEKGEVLCSQEHFCRQVGIVLSGKLQVVKADQKLVLNTIGPAQMFGAATLYSRSDTCVTQTLAAARSQVLLLGRQEMTALFRRDFRLVEQYLAFLSDRVYFLNRKIDAFTASSSEERLALYLCERLDQGGGERLAVPQGLRSLAAELNLSRASLYRALDVFCGQGILRQEGKSLTVLDVPALRRQAHRV